MKPFLLVDEHNAAEYLRRAGWIDGDERVMVRALTGGVSNQVLYVARPERRGEDFVVKQAREQLRTPAPWFSRLERVWREVEVLKTCQRLLADSPSPAAAGEPAATTPRILHEDRENYAFAMTAAPSDHRVWKADLLAGRVEPAIADACGRLLGRLHAGSWQDAAVARQLDDRSIFDELRLDPYYRSVARKFPAYTAALGALIDSVCQHRRSLVHADFSPKNMLVYGEGLLLVDFETGHFGDPAFDLGFFLSHLMLKAAYHFPDCGPYLSLTERFWRTYRGELAERIGGGEWSALERRAVLNFAGCAWARLDGTSQVDYLTDPAARERMRALCRSIFDGPPETWSAATDVFRIMQQNRGVGTRIG